MNWISVYDRRPEDEQKVIALWLDGTQAPVIFRAWDAPDGPERWIDTDGDKVDEPYAWRPQ